MVINESKGIVLVVDDSAESLGMLNTTLVDEGYSVFVAMDGAQALAIAGRMVPDIVLMDAIMPNMNGFDACREMKKNSELSDVPVIFMTGLNDTEHVLMGLQAGGVDYINKPINVDEFLARINVHLNNSRLTRSARSALDEIGQCALACDIHGQLVWATVSARKVLADISPDSDWGDIQLPAQLRYWLSHDLIKDSVLCLEGLDKPLQVRFLGRPSPGEYLLQLFDNDELRARNALREQFVLTEREAEVLFWLARGKTNREIGLILSRSPRTVNKHLEQVYKKMAVENRTSAATLCLQYLNNY